MLIVTVNAGSASAKLAAFDAQPATLKFLKAVKVDGHPAAAGNRHAVLENFLSRDDRTRLFAVAHRVVHGGSRFTAPVHVDAAVRREIEALTELAPLHNPVALQWIDAARDVFGARLAQVAAFDTAFFAGLPRIAAEYAVPPSMTSQGVRRYGFHGLAHQSMWRRWCELRTDLTNGGRLMTLQLGGGSSGAAIADGKPVDTSMGFSPLEGLMMRTRSGDIDPAVVPYLQKHLGYRADEVIDLLNRKSGLAGVSGLEGDVSEWIESPAPQARFAVDLYCYRVRKLIGAYLAVLGGCDGIVFGGGISEYVPVIRARILEGLAWTGIVLDQDANSRARAVEARISADSSSVAVYVMPVDEAAALARAAVAVLMPKPAE